MEPLRRFAIFLAAFGERLVNARAVVRRLRSAFVVEGSAAILLLLLIQNVVLGNSEIFAVLELTNAVSERAVTPALANSAVMRLKYAVTQDKLVTRC
jgi:hypothetical protein